MYKNTLNINIGCGHKAATDWKNFDSSPTLLLEKIPILSKLFKINENTFPKNVLFGDITKKYFVSLMQLKIYTVLTR